MHLIWSVIVNQIVNELLDVGWLLAPSNIFYFERKNFVFLRFEPIYTRFQYDYFQLSNHLAMPPPPQVPT